MNTRHIVVFDFETSSADPFTTQALQIAAVAVHPRRLTVGESFKSLIKPENPDTVEQGALDVNHLDMTVLMEAPSIEQVWHDFTNFVNKFNPKKDPFTAPIPAGYNIKGFDMHIVERMCERFGPVNKKRGGQGLFSNFVMFDVMDDIFRWTENNQVLPNMKLDTVRGWMGLSTVGAHDALVDCEQTAEILIRFLSLYRRLFPKVKFAGAAAA